MDKQDGYNNAQSSDDGQLKVTQSYLQGMCANFGGGMADEQYIRFTEMNDHLSKSFIEVRKDIRRARDLIMHGNPSKGQRALFASLLDRPELAQ